MSEWKEVSLSELGKTITGKTPSSQYPEDFGDEVPFITPSDSFEKKYISRPERYLSRLGSDRLKDKIISSDSIMVTCIGSAMGKVAKNSLPSVTNQQINSIIVNENFDSDYIYYLFKNNYAVFRNAASGSTAIPILNKTDFDNLRFKVELDLNQQRKMVSILSKIDDKIEINNQINQELEAMAKTLYDYWFVQFDFPDQHGKPYKSSGGKMVYNQDLKREIPKGWGVEKLGELIELERGVTYAKSDIVGKTTKDAIGVLRATNITGNVMDLNDLVYLAKDKINNKQIIKQNETLIVMSSGSKEHLGKNAINYYEEVIGFGAFCSKIVPQKYSNYINTFLQSSEFKGYLLKQSMGTNINNLTNSDILDCRIILPNNDILDKFENMVEKNIGLISNNYIQNQELTQLRDWLLPMLMNGQVKVE